ncbi:hypothetical protein ACR2R9_004328 [Cronobacter sakazakii]
MFKVLLYATLSLLPVAAMAAGPAINVGSLNEFMAGGKNTLAKRIHNTGDATAYVRISIHEIEFHSNGESTEKELDSDTIINGKGTGLISTPPRLIIPAKGMQTNRLVFTGDRERERYYRVRYIPVVPESAKEFGLSADETKRYQEQINAGVTVLSGFGTIVTVKPDHTRYDTQISGTGNQLRITNNGNASIVIDALKSCDAPAKNCSSPVVVQLRPGKTLEQTAAPGKIWQYTLAEGSQTKNLNTGK